MTNKKNLVQEHWHILALLAWAFLTHYPFIYINGAGEGDSFVLVNGIINAINKQDFLKNPLLVFNFYSFGYYWFIFQIQSLFAIKLTSFFALINHLAFIFSLLTTIPLYLFLKDLTGKKIAFYSVLIYHLAPTIFEISTYGHPVTAAWLFIITALYTFQRSILQDEQHSKYLVAISAVLAGIAMCLRADVLLVTPLLIGLLYYHDCLNKRWITRLGLLLLGTIFIFSVLQFAATGASWSGFSPRVFFDDINKFHITEGIFSRLARGLATLALTIGPLSGALALGAYVYLYRKQKKLFILLAVWTIPILIFWLPFPTPSRHFLYAIPGIIAATVYLLKEVSKKHMPIIITLFLVFNYYSPLLLYPVIIASRPKVWTAKGQKQVSFSVPLLPAIENHHYLQEEIDRYQQHANIVAGIKDKSIVLIDNFVLLAINKIITSGRDYSWGGRACPDGNDITYNMITTSSNEYLLVRAPYGANMGKTMTDLEQNPNAAASYLIIFPQTLNKYPDLKTPAGYRDLFISEPE